MVPVRSIYMEWKRPRAHFSLDNDLKLLSSEVTSVLDGLIRDNFERISRIRDNFERTPVWSGEVFKPTLVWSEDFRTRFSLTIGRFERTFVWSEIRGRFERTIVWAEDVSRSKIDKLGWILSEKPTAELTNKFMRFSSVLRVFHQSKVAPNDSAAQKSPNDSAARYWSP